jgi:hypothetical protein
VDFLTDDFAFEIVHKLTWHINTILLFVEKEESKTQPHLRGGAVFLVRTI